MVETTAFEAFWKAYPRHVGKLAAIKAYAKARRLASAADILAGVERYKRLKPAYADFCHPATWLNQGRWLDEADSPQAPLPPPSKVPDAYKPYVPMRLRKFED